MAIISRKVGGLWRLMSYKFPKLARSNTLHQKKVSDKFTVVVSPIQHNSREKMDELYSDIEFIKYYISPDRQKFYREVINVLAEKDVDYSGKDIADIGCGTGHLLLAIRNGFSPSSLTGFEYSEAALKVARKVLPEGTFKSFDLYESDQNYQFDIIFCTEVLEHLLYPEKALRTVLNMIKPSGIAMITVPDGRIDTYLGHINFWSPESWNIFIKSICNNCDIETGLIENGKTNFAIIKRK